LEKFIIRTAVKFLQSGTALRSTRPDYCFSLVCAALESNCYNLCRRALDKAVEERLIARNPALDCKTLICKQQEMNILSREEMRKFLIQTNREGYYEVFLMEFAAGLRLGEMMALQWDDLNMTSGELRVSKQF